MKMIPFVSTFKQAKSLIRFPNQFIFTFRKGQKALELFLIAVIAGVKPPQKSRNMKRFYAYLMQRRKIDPETISFLCTKGVSMRVATPTMPYLLDMIETGKPERRMKKGCYPIGHTGAMFQVCRKAIFSTITADWNGCSYVKRRLTCCHLSVCIKIKTGRSAIT